MTEKYQCQDCKRLVLYHELSKDTQEEITIEEGEHKQNNDYPIVCENCSIGVVE